MTGKHSNHAWAIRLTAFTVACALATAAGAQQRPLVTEDPLTVGTGQILIETGVDVAQGVSFPLSGLRGDLVSGPVIGVSVGVGPIAEIQVDGSFYRQLTITERVPAPLAQMRAR